ncbi:MAG: DUF4301 family protein [Bacteroidales bacterium]
MFTENDLKQISGRGIDLRIVEQQIAHFRKGFPFANLVKPALKGDGIQVYASSRIEEFEGYYDKHSGGLKVVKFVPASGAASRMFKNLFSFIEHVNRDHQDKMLAEDTSFDSVHYFIEHIQDFAFYPELARTMEANGLSPEECLHQKDYASVIEFLVDEKGLGYGNLPKGLLLFHRYGTHSRRAMEEHLVEAALYATGNDGKSRVHFTISPEHSEKFRAVLADVKPAYEESYNVQLDVSFSYQKSSTDTISVDMDNKPFREKDGLLVFRPGGHGALIENLKGIDADIVFVKNIDNVVPDRLKAETVTYKKSLAGLLLSLQKQTFSYIKLLEDSSPEPDQLEDIRLFAEKNLSINISEKFDALSDFEKSRFLFRILNRPIRVCGMVKNEGEPGGGPFWVKNTKGEISLQIVESSQIDLNNPVQKTILNASTHFNPVDLVCAFRDFRGNLFDLTRFTDPETGFISVKSKNGKSLKALELPGLWNGAMADWITVFVEVPVITFNPVKTVNDLLRLQHLPQ